MTKLILSVILITILTVECYSQAAGIQVRVFSEPKGSDCKVTDIKVKDVWPETCNLETGCNYLYPVFTDNFNDVFDLPNKWDFRVNSSVDNGDENGPGCTYYYDGYFDHSQVSAPITNHNVRIINGILNLVTIPESITRNGTPYTATSGALTSLSRFRTGVFEARIKVPTCNKMWPALWLLQRNGAYNEIDMFEFYDNDVTADACETYNLHKMTMHTGSSTDYSGNKCERGDKYPLDIEEWHTYKLDWDEYSMAIYVDGNLRGFGTKYHKGHSFPMFACKYGSVGQPIDPLFNFDCERLNQQPDNLLPSIPHIDWGSRPWWLPGSISWPPPQPPQPYLANKVDETIYFPDKNSAMSMLLTNAVNSKYRNDDFSMFSQDEMNMQIDWVTISQPFCCGVDKTVCNLNDLDNQTYFTDILTGRKLTIANTGGSCSFEQNFPRQANWRDVPVVLLATDEIAINSEAIFPGGTYTEMQIVSCGSAQRRSSEEQSQLSAFFDAQNALMDSLNTPVYDSIVNAYIEHYVDSINREYAQYQPGHRKHMGENGQPSNMLDMAYADSELSVLPNPATDLINIKCDDWLFDKIETLYVSDINGREMELRKARTINITELAKGSYILKIVMDDGTLLKKKLIKL
jgi:hypothetical protein